MSPGENLNLVAAEQIRSWYRQVSTVRLDTSGSIFSFDAGYDPVQLCLALADLPVCLLVRLRAGRCFYADPASQPPTGRPRRHGAKFVCENPATWPVLRRVWTSTEPHHGRVCVQAWSGLHAAPQNHTTRATRLPRPLIRGTIIRLEVEHLPRPTKAPTPLWFWWSGRTPPDLSEVWQAYIARFSIEHTFRFFKQTLKWTTPKLRTPAAADRWTWLLLLAYVQLRLARATRSPTCACPGNHPYHPYHPYHRSAAHRPVIRTSQLLAPPCTYGQPCERAKTLRTVARTSSRQALSPLHASRRSN